MKTRRSVRVAFACVCAWLLVCDVARAVQTGSGAHSTEGTDDPVFSELDSLSSRLDRLSATLDQASVDAKRALIDPPPSAAAAASKPQMNFKQVPASKKTTPVATAVAKQVKAAAKALKPSSQVPAKMSATEVPRFVSTSSTTAATTAAKSGAKTADKSAAKNKAGIFIPTCVPPFCQPGMITPPLPVPPMAFHPPIMSNMGMAVGMGMGMGVGMGMGMGMPNTQSLTPYATPTHVMTPSTQDGNQEVPVVPMNPNIDPVTHSKVMSIEQEKVQLVHMLNEVRNRLKGRRDYLNQIESYRTQVKREIDEEERWLKDADTRLNDMTKEQQILQLTANMNILKTAADAIAQQEQRLNDERTQQSMKRQELEKQLNDLQQQMAQVNGIAGSALSSTLSSSSSSSSFASSAAAKESKIESEMKEIEKEIETKKSELAAEVKDVDSAKELQKEALQEEISEKKKELAAVEK